jgi:hypothetical protein
MSFHASPSHSSTMSFDASNWLPELRLITGSCTRQPSKAHRISSPSHGLKSCNGSAGSGRPAESSWNRTQLFSLACISSSSDW